MQPNITTQDREATPLVSGGYRLVLALCAPSPAHVVGWLPVDPSGLSSGLCPKVPMARHSAAPRALGSGCGCLPCAGLAMPCSPPACGAFLPSARGRWLQAPQSPRCCWQSGDRCDPVSGRWCPSTLSACCPTVSSSRAGIPSLRAGGMMPAAGGMAGRDRRTPRREGTCSRRTALTMQGCTPLNPTGLSTRHPRGLECVRCGLQGPGRCFSRNTLVLH